MLKNYNREKWLLDFYAADYEAYKIKVNRCIPWKPAEDRIAHMIKIGILASLLALIGGDMLLGGIFFVFFLVMNIVQIMAFAKGKTPYPNWCWVFTMLTGIIDIAVMRLAGNHPWAYALSTGWLSIGSLVTFTGLLINMPKKRSGGRR